MCRAPEWPVFVAMKSILRRIREFFPNPAQRPVPVIAAPPVPPDIGEFTIEALWNDFDKRTWQFKLVEGTLGNSDPRLLNWIGSIDYSGFTREKCLKALIGGYTPGDENRILLRLADWVPQVRDLARDWILAHFRDLPPEAIRANERLLLHLIRKERLQDDPGLVEITRDLLDRTKAMTAERFFEFGPMFRRFLFSKSLDEDGHLRRWILDDPDPFVRLLLLRRFDPKMLDGDEIRRLESDGSVFVRRRFFLARMDVGITPERADLVRLALDPSRGLRELGQYYLNKLYREDAHLIYKGSEGEAVYFVADYARKDDAEIFLEGVRTGGPATQFNCLRALSVVAQERLGELDLAVLIGRSRKCRAVLLPVLPGILSMPSILALRGAIVNSGPSGLCSFLRVLEKKSFWAFVDESLGVLLAGSHAVVENHILKTIYRKVEIYEPIAAVCRDSIEGRIASLREDPRGRYQRLANHLGFILKGY